MTRAKQRLADLEAAVAELRSELTATSVCIGAAWKDGFATAQDDADRYAAAAAASQPRPRHLQLVSGGAS
jgi:hypothetical protein